ncbi:GntR family transcriptional regulator [Streptomyces lydicus]|uniref:GntR family transcriptional regulator n=1 Tax=Streptomyces lydicus TaxID=47763 RepID=UPI0037D23E1C
MRADQVSRNTIRRALRVLQTEGLVNPVPGAGWRVSSNPIRPLVDRITDLINEDSLGRVRKVVCAVGKSWCVVMS